MLTRFLVDKFFESNYKTLVVLANPKTIIDTKYAKKEVKEQIIRADQLVKYIKDTCNNSKQEPLSNKQMLDWAEKFIKLHIDKKNKYLEKYNKYLLENNNELNDVKGFAEAKISKYGKDIIEIVSRYV